MPIYIYQNKKTKKVKEIIQTMSEEHVYFEDGIQWDRIFTVPQGVVPIKFDPDSPQDFVHKTRHSKGSIGNLMDISQELSDKRKEKGEDKVQNEFFNKWSKKRHNRRHPNDTR